MTNGTFTPQPQITSQLALGNALARQAGQGQRSAAGLSPFANLLQGLGGGFIRGQAQGAQRRNQALRQEALANIGAALQGGDFNAASGAAFAGGDPTLANLGVQLAGQGAAAKERAATAARTAKERTVAAGRAERSLQLQEAAGRRAAEKAERETQERARTRQVQQALFKQLGVTVPTTQQAAAVQPAQPGQPTVSQAVASVSPQPIPVPVPSTTIPSAPRAQQGPAARAIDPETKRLAAFQIANGDTVAGLKTLNDARKQINKDFKPTTQQRNDLVKSKAAAISLNRELKRYQLLVNEHGFEAFDTAAAASIKSARNGILLKMKELENLGVLNGPDLDILNPLLFDPTLPVDNITEAFSFIPRLISSAFKDAPSRAKLSADQLRDQIATVVEAKIATVPGAAAVLPVLREPITPGLGQETGQPPLPAPGPGAVNAAPAPRRTIVDIDGNVIQQ